MGKSNKSISQVFDILKGIKPEAYSTHYYEFSNQFTEEVAGGNDQEYKFLEKIGFDYLNIIVQAESNSVKRFKDIEASSNNEFIHGRAQFYDRIKALKEEQYSFCQEFERCRLKDDELRSAKRALLFKIQMLEKELSEGHEGGNIDG